MPIFLYIMLLLSCNNTILLGADRDSWYTRTRGFENSGYQQTGITTTSVYDWGTECDTGAWTSQSTLTPILDLHEEITDLKALACYKLYESELNGKSQEELNQLLKECFDQPDDTRPLYRQKAIALLLGGAQAESTGCIDTPLYNTILFDDIPFAHYICTRYPEDPNRVNTFAPLWFSCKSTAMAQLLIKHGADITAKLRLLFSGNILHHLNPENKECPALIQLYCSIQPLLINETDEAGYTPLFKHIKIRMIVDPTYITSSALSCAYTLVNLGADTISGRYCGQTPLELLMEHVNDKSLSTEKRKNIRVLAEYIKNPPKIHSSLFEQLWDQWHDKIDLNINTLKKPTQ